ncbi:MAG: DUF1961 family protein [Planctomycetota bacterium]
MTEFVKGDVVYENPLSGPDGVKDFIAEGQPITSFPMGAMRLENAMDPEEGQAANYLFWCPQKMPADICVEWDFRPIREPGLAMLWFCADGQGGKDLFDPSLAKRAGEYKQYHSSDINGYHASYFRRKNVKWERTFHTCNMRKSAGFHLVTQGPDPIPSVIDVQDSYHIEVIKCGGTIRFSVNDLQVFQWQDPGEGQTGPILGEGYIGFRQMAPLIADYANLVVREVRQG